MHKMCPVHIRCAQEDNVSYVMNRVTSTGGGDAGTNNGGVCLVHERCARDESGAGSGVCRKLTGVHNMVTGVHKTVRGVHKTCHDSGHVHRWRGCRQEWRFSNVLQHSYTMTNHISKKSNALL